MDHEVGRNLLDAVDGFLLSTTHLILDRDPVFTSQFRQLLGDHLRQVVTEYAAHYLTERSHQGLGNELITSRPVAANDNGQVRCRRRLGGLLKYYTKEAA